MQRAIIVERKNNGGLPELSQYLAKGWVVEKMQPFHPSVSVATGSTYTSPKEWDRGAILVIIENLGVDDVE